MASDLAVTVSLADGIEVLVRRYADGEVEADVRGTGYGRTWTPVDLVGGSFRVEHLESAGAVDDSDIMPGSEFDGPVAVR